jgi:hypothetical protein
LAVYTRPHDPDDLPVCGAMPTKSGHPARHDYEYTRNEIADLFMMFAPLEGWRNVKFTDRHAKARWRFTTDTARAKLK